MIERGVKLYDPSDGLISFISMLASIQGIVLECFSSTTFLCAKPSLYCP